MATSRRRSMATRPRRSRAWARTHFSDSISAGGSDENNLLGAFLLSAGMSAGPVGITIGRVRFSVGWQTTSTPSPLDALGIGVVVRHIGSSDALSPLTDPHADWMFWTKVFPGLEGSGSALVGNAAWHFDVKSMRRMQELGQEVVLVLECTPLLAGNYAIGASTLLLLP